MSSDIKALRTRIKSIDSTMHLTKAMSLVASSKIHRANDGMRAANDYAQALSDMIALLLRSPECDKNPYIHSEGDRTRLIVIAGDRGLAGGYNANVFRAAKEYPHAQLIPIGKRAGDRFGKYALSSETFSVSDAYALALTLYQGFINKEYDRLGIIGTKYVSMLTQEVYTRFLLPLTPIKEKETVSPVLEPDGLTILNTAVLEYISGMILSAVRESFACEVAARRTAMDSAEKNASAMIDTLQLSYNRARQSAITQEITEIIAGSGI